jgi:hypothetical protein
MPEVHFTSQLFCEKCSNIGEVTGDNLGPFCTSGLFYMRVPKRMEGPAEVICGKCGTEQKIPQAQRALE